MTEPTAVKIDFVRLEAVGATVTYVSDRDGWVSTGFACWTDAEGMIIVTDEEDHVEFVAPSSVTKIEYED